MADGTTTIADQQAPLEAVIKDEVFRMYQEVADNPEAEFHFYHGREAALMFGYDPGELDRAPAGAVASFAGVGNPHDRSALQPGEIVLDLGSGAGLDAIISSWQVGPTGKVIGVDLNPNMCLKAKRPAEATGTTMECHEGQMEQIRSAVVSGFRFRKGATRDAAEAYGVKAVHFTAQKPAGDS